MRQRSEWCRPRPFLHGPPQAFPDLPALALGCRNDTQRLIPPTFRRLQTFSDFSDEHWQHRSRSVEGKRVGKPIVVPDIGRSLLPSLNEGRTPRGAGPDAARAGSETRLSPSAPGPPPQSLAALRRLRPANMVGSKSGSKASRSIFWVKDEPREASRRFHPCHKASARWSSCPSAPFVVPQSRSLIWIIVCYEQHEPFPVPPS